MKNFYRVGWLLALGFSGNAFGWGAIGHATVGEIAERALTPRAKALVFKVLGPEPLSTAANYPDEVRSDKRYAKFADYHFATIPANGAYGDLPPPDHDMNSIMVKAMKMIAKRNVSRDEKILYMKYLIHIVGDTHQPLHVSTPGSLGGNLCKVKIADPATGKEDLENIHHVWDEVLIEYERRVFQKMHPEKKDPWFGYAEYADMILAEPKVEAVKSEVERAGPVKEADFATWITDTFRIGESAYPKVTEIVPGRRPYCSFLDPKTKKFDNSGYDAKSIPTLDEAYVEKWLPTVRSQILKGGLRLAKVLDKIAADAHVKPMDPAKETRLIDSILAK
ncbi:MAG: S1/P1 nuclease [Bdellovibrionales bacterium]|nr:S1/P1 nuclease [Bdellovibrionales bacterium]